MKIQDIVKIAALTLMAAALMPIRANANPGAGWHAKPCRQRTGFS